MVTFPVAGHRCPTTVTKLYCLVTEAHVCEQVAQGLTVKQPGIELTTSQVTSQHLNLYTTKPQVPSGSHSSDNHLKYYFSIQKPAKQNDCIQISNQDTSTALYTQ